MFLVWIIIKILNGLNSFSVCKAKMIIKISPNMKSYAHILIHFREW